MNYDELLLKLQRFAGDGDESAYTSTVVEQPTANDFTPQSGGDYGYSADYGSTTGSGSDVSANTNTLDTSSEEIANTGRQLEDGFERLNAITTDLVTGEALDAQSSEQITNYTSEAQAQVADFTGSIATLATFASSVAEAYRGQADSIRAEVVEWGTSLKSLLNSLVEGATGSNIDANGNRVEVAQGSISSETFAAQTQANTSQMLAGAVQVSQGTRELARGACQQIADTGRYFTSTTGTTPVGAFKNLVSGITSAGGASNTTTGSVVGSLLKGGLTLVGSIFSALG